MKERRKHADQTNAAPAAPPAPTKGRARASLLVLAKPMGHWRAKLRRIRAIGVDVTTASTPERAEALLGSHKFDAAIVSPLATVSDTRHVIRRLADHATPFAVCSPTRDFELAVLSMRHGSTDYICTDDTEERVSQRIIDFVAASRVQEASPRAPGDSDAYTQLSRHITTLCRDLSNAYSELSDQVVRIAVVSEYDSCVSRELDLESALRATLEFILARLGPANAAIMLPSSSRDYTLAAYVNHDVEKQTIDCLLDTVANTAAPRIEALKDARVLDHEDEIEATFGYASHWLEGRTALVVPCRHGSECLAAIALFRTQARPFTDEHAHTLSFVAERFARHLHKLVRIKHRHLPEEDWRALGDDDRGRDSAA